VSPGSHLVISDGSMSVEAMRRSPSN
jgi:hypothetical protein